MLDAIQFFRTTASVIWSADTDSHPFDVQLEIWIRISNPDFSSGIQISISKCFFESISTHEFHWQLILKVSRAELIMFLQTNLLFL